MLVMTTLIFGSWTKFISNNMVPGAECGFLLSAKIL
jgi:hypothetical protein